MDIGFALLIGMIPLQMRAGAGLCRVPIDRAPEDGIR
jgi:hypothetical protein